MADDDLYIMVKCMSVCDEKVTKLFWQVGKLFGLEGWLWPWPSDDDEKGKEMAVAVRSGCY